MLNDVGFSQIRYRRVDFRDLGFLDPCLRASALFFPPRILLFRYASECNICASAQILLSGQSGFRSSTPSHIFSPGP
jgi:hypothetical protein